jgi:phosphate starvation-inducible protein PhoH and related proteins
MLSWWRVRRRRCSRRANFQDYETLRRQGILLQNGELNGMLRLVTADSSVSLRSLAESGKQRSAGIKRMVQPRSLNQRLYLEAIEQADMVFGIGPAGTGKTYLAVAMAAAALLAKKVAASSWCARRSKPANALAFCPGPSRKRSILIFARSTMRFTTCSSPSAWTGCWSAT